MSQNRFKTIGRRRFLAVLLTIPAFAILRRVIKPTAYEDIVEVDGWILKRSDLEGDNT